jgi:type I site-specific restriction endonuclease
MNINCSQLDDLLFDASPLAMETAARHAEQCADCAERLASWNDLTATAQAMQQTWDNDLLWPRIKRALKEEQRSRPATWLRHAAAAVLLTISLGATMFFALRVQTHKAAFDDDIIRLSALDDVERAEKEHIDAIARLERVTDAKLENTDTPLMASYKEKLMLLDDAIADCRVNIERNRQNAHLREQLLAMYSEKQQTLSDVLREDSNVSNR